MKRFLPTPSALRECCRRHNVTDDEPNDGMLGAPTNDEQNNAFPNNNVANDQLDDRAADFDEAAERQRAGLPPLNNFDDANIDE